MEQAWGVPNIPIATFNANSAAYNREAYLWSTLWQGWEGDNIGQRQMLLDCITTKGSRLLDIFPWTDISNMSETDVRNKGISKIVNNTVYTSQWLFNSQTMPEKGQRTPGLLATSQRTRQQQTLSHTGFGLNMPIDMMRHPDLLQGYLHYVKAAERSIEQTLEFQVVQMICSEARTALHNAQQFTTDELAAQEIFLQNWDLIGALQKSGSNFVGLENKYYNICDSRGVKVDTVLTTSGTAHFLHARKAIPYQHVGNATYGSERVKMLDTEGKSRTPLKRLEVVESRLFKCMDSLVPVDPMVRDGFISQRFDMLPPDSNSEFRVDYTTRERSIAINNCDIHQKVEISLFNAVENSGLNKCDPILMNALFSSPGDEPDLEHDWNAWDVFDRFQLSTNLFTFLKADTTGMRWNGLLALRPRTANDSFDQIKLNPGFSGTITSHQMYNAYNWVENPADDSVVGHDTNLQRYVGRFVNDEVHRKTMAFLNILLPDDFDNQICVEVITKLFNDFVSRYADDRKAETEGIQGDLDHIMAGVADNDTRLRRIMVYYYWLHRKRIENEAKNNQENYVREEPNDGKKFARTHGDWDMDDFKRTMCQINVNRDFWRVLMDYNIPFPVGFLLFRMYIRVKLGSMVFLKRGPETGLLLVQDLGVMFNRDTATFTLRVNIRMTSKAVVINRRHLEEAPGVFIKKYEGGGDVSFFNASKNETEVAAMVNTVHEHAPNSIYSVAVPYDHKNKYIFTDISGELHGEICLESKGPHYATADYYSKKWNWKPNKNAFHPDRAGEVGWTSLSVAAQASYYQYNPSTRQCDIPVSGVGPLGPDPSSFNQKVVLGGEQQGFTGTGFANESM